MIVQSREAERDHLLRTAEAMAAAARTAPKTKGVDHLETLIVDGAEKARLADEMDAIAAESGAAFLGHLPAKLVIIAFDVLGLFARHWLYTSFIRRFHWID